MVDKFLNLFFTDNENLLGFYCRYLEVILFYLIFAKNLLFFEILDFGIEIWIIWIFVWTCVISWGIFCSQEIDQLHPLSIHSDLDGPSFHLNF